MDVKLYHSITIVLYFAFMVRSACALTRQLYRPSKHLLAHLPQLDYIYLHRWYVPGIEPGTL